MFFDDIKEDAKLVYVKNLKEGMITKEEGKIHKIEQHTKRPDALTGSHYYNVTVDSGDHEETVTFAMPAHRLLTVLR